MRKPAQYLKPHSPRYWGASIAVLAVAVVLGVVLSILESRWFPLIIAAIMAVPLLWCIDSFRSQYLQRRKH
jgi:cobalamin biosynthesis protein CobD/CbiB